MPLPSTLQLLLRPTPIGLDEYHQSITNQAAYGSELFSDLTIQTPDGSVSCHQSILVPLSSLLKSVLHPNPFFPGLVHTVVVPIRLKTIETILKIIYTGKAFIRNKVDKDQVLSGLKVLGIHLSGLVFSDFEECSSTNGVGAGLHCMTWGDDQITVPSPISTITPQATSQPPTPIVQPSTTPYMDDVKPLVPVPLPPHNQLPTRLDKVRVQLGRDKLSTLAKHFKDHKERDLHAFKCSECDKGFKHKKLLEIHRIQHHDNLVVNPLFNGEELANCKNNNIESSPASKTERIKKRKRNMDHDDESTEGAAVVSEAPLECTLCSTPVSSKWYLPPSRHGCTVNNTQSGQKETSTSARKRPKTKIITRRLSVSRPTMPEVADKIVLNTHENNNTDNVVPIKGSIKDIVQFEPTPLHECPLTNCARQCRSKADLQVHLAMSHYKEELEKEYITDCGETRCKVCEKILPGNKQGFLKHMAVDHNVVMDYVERDRALEVLHKASTEKV